MICKQTLQIIEASFKFPIILSLKAVTHNWQKHDKTINENSNWCSFGFIFTQHGNVPSKNMIKTSINARLACNATVFFLTLNNWIMFFFIWFYLLMLFTVNNTVFCETGRMQFIAGQHWGYWWHQYPECWVYTHAFPLFLWVNSLWPSDAYMHQ